MRSLFNTWHSSQNAAFIRWLVECLTSLYIPVPRKELLLEREHFLFPFVSGKENRLFTFRIQLQFLITFHIHSEIGRLGFHAKLGFPAPLPFFSVSLKTCQTCSNIQVLICLNIGRIGGYLSKVYQNYCIFFQHETNKIRSISPQPGSVTLRPNCTTKI